MRLEKSLLQNKGIACFDSAQHASSFESDQHAIGFDSIQHTLDIGSAQHAFNIDFDQFERSNCQKCPDKPADTSVREVKRKFLTVGSAAKTLLLISSLLSFVYSGEVGGLSGAYLRPAVGAAALAMGGANSAVPDYYASWYNPAVLANLKEKKFSVGAGLRSQGRSDLYTDFEFRVPPRLGMGFFLLYRGDPFIDNLYDYQDNKLDKTSYTSFTGKISVSYYISRKLSAGANIGINYQKLPTSYDYDSDKWTYSSASGIGSIDLAFTYKLNNSLYLAMIAKDLFSLMDWEIKGDEMSPTIEDRPLPSLTIASKYSDSLKQRPFIWTTDLKGYIFDGDWNRLPHAEAYLSTGVEWQYWKSFFIRMGLGDILLNRDIIHNTDDYFSEFPCKITAGFALDLSRIKKGMIINYGLATDKAWAGVDQQLDLNIRF